MVTKIILFNSSKIQSLWPIIRDYFEAQCTSTLLPFDLVYHSITNLLLVASSVITDDVVRLPVLKILLRLTNRNFSNSFYDKKLCKKIAVGLNRILISNLEYFKTCAEWEQITELIRWTYKLPQTKKDGFEILCYTVTSTLENTTALNRVKNGYKTFVSRENFTSCMDLIHISLKESQSFVMKSIELIQHIIIMVPIFYPLKNKFAESDENDALQLYLIPAFQYLCFLSRDIRPEIQNTALATLQRVLFSQELSILTSESWMTIIDKILFPLLSELLKSPIEVTNKDKAEEIRLRLLSLLGKTFLQYLNQIITHNNFNVLWKRVIGFFEKFLKVDNSEMAEAETLKNILLVMHAQGLLRSPTGEKDDNSKRLDLVWGITWEEINRFSPKLKQDFDVTVNRAFKTK